MNNQTPNFHALLIGINFYFPHELPDGRYKNLKGCVPDINHVETYLKNIFNLTPDQIIKLTATASDNPEQPQDLVYIHYSSHGERTQTIYVK